MMKSILLFALIAFASAQQFQDILTIDDFSVETPVIIILIPSNANFPLTDSAFTSDSGILGTERDIQLVVETGPSNNLLTTGVAAGAFTCATPQDSSGFSLLTWDGVDGSIDNAQNIGNVDLTQNLGESFRTLMETDLPTTITFSVYNGNTQCSRAINLPGGDTLDEYIIDFTSFSGNCNFQSVTSIDIFVEMFDNVDVFLELFTTYGPVPQTPSPSRTRTRTPTPTPSETPPPSDTCVCRCPVFVCEVFRVDDAYYFYDGLFGTFFTVQFFNPGFFTQFFGPQFFVFIPQFFGGFFGGGFFGGFFDIWYYLPF